VLTELKRHDRAPARDSFVADATAVRRVHDAAARTEEVLEVSLHLPPRRYLVLVGSLEDRFGRALGVARRRERCDVAIERAGTGTDVGVADGEAGRIVVAPLDGAFSTTPASTLKSSILRFAGAPITRANTLTDCGLSARYCHVVKGRVSE
jgi:hypothetical protein